MVSLKLIRQNFKLVESKLLTTSCDHKLITQLQRVVHNYHQVKQQQEKTEAIRNNLSKQIGFTYLKNKQADVKKLSFQMQQIKQELDALDAQVAVATTKLEAVLFQIPNLPDDSVPIGKSAQDNKVLFSSGQIPNFSFNPLNHWDLAEQLGLIDFQLGPKLSGTKFVVYQGLGSELYRALINFTLDHQVYQNGYTPYTLPVLLNEQGLFGTGQLPKFQGDLYQVEEQQFLSPTGEVQLVNLYANRLLKVEELPIKITTNSLCFRKESGAAGKDTRGIIRLHQFQKTELVVICQPADSWKQLEIIVENAESILKKLKLPYQKVVLCTGDLGFSAAKTYDLEVWLPGAKTYREISSCSNTLDFQAMRAKIRYRDPKTHKNQYVHCLNGSGVAIDRLFAAVLENYQQADGSVIVPEVLLSYLRGLKVISKPQ